MTNSYRRVDAAEFFETEEDFAILLEDAVESGDPRVMINALAIMVRARGMTAMAEKTGISRKGLFKALSETGNPSFENFGKIVDALGYRVAIVPKEAAAKKAKASRKTKERESDVASA